MPSFLDRLAATAATLHAQRVFAKFRKAAGAAQAAQHAALARALRLTANGEYGHALGLRRVRTLSDLRSAAPLATYEDLRGPIERVLAGEPRALFSPGVRVLMFATSSGTTARRKHIPVTPEFVCDYRRGWNTFGLRLLMDHPRAILRPILQSTGRYDESHTPEGTPIGAITGLLARSQKRLVQRYYVGRPEIAEIDDPTARYYTLMRFGASRDVAFAITANPATLIRMAQVVDQYGETLIRDVRDGTLSRELVSDAPLRNRLEHALRPDPATAQRLEDLRRREGRLRPRDYWNLEFLACWTGGSMSLHLARLAEWYGNLPVRDIGLLASEGRVSLPFEDNTPAGVLDVQSAVFEFIPLSDWETPQPRTLLPHELETGRDYVVVLTNTAGLIRYRLDDVVRVRGWYEQAPVVEFIRRAGRVTSLVGEKLTEDQVIAAMAQARGRLGLPEFDFILGPVLGDPPTYRLICSLPQAARLGDAVDQALAEQNEEYASRRKSLRLGAVQVCEAHPERFAAFDRELARRRGGAAEQYKRACLLLSPGEGDELLTSSGA